MRKLIVAGVLGLAAALGMATTQDFSAPVPAAAQTYGALSPCASCW